MDNLKRILETRYGAGLAVSDPITILWAAAALADEKGVLVAKAELKKANRWRERQGQVPAHVPFGDRLF